MNTFDIFAGNDIKEQMEKLHECVTQYIDHIKETVEAQSDKNGKAVDVDKILSNLGVIKSNLIDVLLSKKASNYVLHSLNVIYNFDAFLNPIATTVVTYAIRQLYINKVSLEIINNINNVIKCVCMDMIARSKANRGLAEVSSMSKDYNMKISEVISITQKYVDSRDAQVMQMLDQTIQHDIEGFKENLESADKLIEAFSQNDKWVAEWGTTTKAITLQMTNNLCLKIRKDMGSYITALSTCLDRHVVDNIDFKGVYDERSIDVQIRDNEKQIQSEEKDVTIDESDKKAMIAKGKDLAENKHIEKYSEYKELSDEDDPARFKIALKDICDSIQGSTSTDESNSIVISKRFYELMGVEDLRLYIYDTLDFEYSNSVENLIKNRYSIMKFDKRINGAQPSKGDKVEILRSKNKMLTYIKALSAEEKYGKK